MLFVTHSTLSTTTHSHTHSTPSHAQHTLTHQHNPLTVPPTLTHPHTTLTVPPTLTPGQLVFDVPEGDLNFVITLNVTGNPLPTNEQTVWQFNGGPLGSGVTGTGTSLSFTSVSRDHAGMYTVSAVTEAGSSNTANITFNVLCESLLQACSHTHC